MNAPSEASPASDAAVLALDSSALVRRYVDDPHRPLVLETMAGAAHWCASALCRTEVPALLHRAALDQFSATKLRSRFRDDWDAVSVVPVDDRCLVRAGELAALFGLRTVDAVHLAAADRLPRPVRYLTFARRQIPAAAALGLEVVSPLAGADW